MEAYIREYIKKLFPSFNSPIRSRFSQFFREISEKTKLINKSSKKESKKDLDDNNLGKYLIIPNKIINGTEKRTSIIIKGIPSAFGVENFYKLLTKFCSDIEFFYVPGYAVNKWQYIYAFANLGHRKGVLDIYEGLTIMRDKYKIYQGFDFSKIEVYFCKSQNINGLITKYQTEVNQSNLHLCK